ncbi:MAG: DNA-processing protein DprA [Boseongicola sp. SB0662_bin_57]|nr:DNA-processing protein DprA [Boseongicola sp. SB0662_bin_57]
MALTSGIGPARSTISPRRELGAYEALFLRQGATFKTLAEKFAADETALPSDFVSWHEADEAAAAVIEKLHRRRVYRFGVRINKAGDYPAKLRDAKHPVELLYYQGTWELSEMRGLAVVGSRKPSEEGAKRAARLAKEIVRQNFSVVSGLAAGIDTVAHRAALDAGGRTIAVIGTPLGEKYPKENSELQDHIAEEHLLVSQVPVLRYAAHPFQHKRYYFPQRNATMSALTEGTIIVEAGETSGTLTQARAALYQGRKLFILDSCFQNPAITWPARFEKKGAIRVREPDDIWNALDTQ